MAEGRASATGRRSAPSPIAVVQRFSLPAHFLNAGLCSLGILISLAIGFRQPDRKSSRALALAFLWFSTNLGASYAPPQRPLVYVRVMNDAAFVPGSYFLLWFAIHYPDGSPARWRRGLRRLLPLFLVGAVVATAMHVASALGRMTPDAAGTAYLAYVGAAGPLALLAFFDGWWQSTGVRDSASPGCWGALRFSSLSAIRPGSTGRQDAEHEERRLAP